MSLVENQQAIDSNVDGVEDRKHQEDYDHGPHDPGLNNNATNNGIMPPKSTEKKDDENKPEGSKAGENKDESKKGSKKSMSCSLPSFTSAMFIA